MAIEVKLEEWAAKSEADEAAVSAWFKKPGSPVRQGDLLAELIVEKVNLEVEAPSDGILLEIVAAVGQSVTPGSVLARLGSPAEWAEIQAAAAKPTFTGTGSVAAAPVASGGQNPAPVPSSLAPVGEVVASPVAKRLLREHNLTLAEVAAFVGGSVRRIGEDEVNRYLAARPASASPGSSGAEVVPYAGLRRTIGDRMSRSLREMAQLTLSSEADVTELVRQREGRKAQAPALSYTALAARAVALSLPRHPFLNASLEGESIRLHSSLNLGIAVNLADGLVVPVIKEAGTRPAADLTAEINRLGELARSKGLTVEDNSGGTFTITNLGAFDVDVFTPIINPPQVAILGLGRIRDQAGVKDGQFSPRKMLWLSLTFDHRLVDGAPAAAFLKEVRERLENPAGLFD